jgi:hypothetical protein
VHLACAGQTGQGVHTGILTLRVPRRHHHITLGTTSFACASGKGRRVTIRVWPRRARRIASGHRRQHVTAYIHSRDPSGQEAYAQKTIRLTVTRRLATQARPHHHAHRRRHHALGVPYR